MTKEKQTVVCDLGLITNEVLVFNSDSTVNFYQKDKLRDLMIINQSQVGRPDIGPHVEGKLTFGNSLRAKIAAKFGSPVQSPRG